LCCDGRFLIARDLFNSCLVLIPVVQPKADILGVAEPGTTTAGGDLKGPDKPKLSKCLGNCRWEGRFPNSVANGQSGYTILEITRQVTANMVRPLQIANKGVQGHYQSQQDNKGGDYASPSSSEFLLRSHLRSTRRALPGICHRPSLRGSSCQRGRIQVQIPRRQVQSARPGRR